MSPNEVETEPLTLP